jgi:outer membrane protein assembly factor BamB
MDRRTFLAITLAASTFSQSKKPVTQSRPQGLPWTQWGGPNRNFQTTASGIKDTWPANGPRVIWKRPLGEGYSSPIVEGGMLYTMYGRRGEEIVLAANAETGETLWEQSASMTFQSDAQQDMGNGPYSTPLIVGDRLFTTGVAGRLQCLDKKSGKVLWTQQLWTDHQGSRLMYGYASSPIAFRDTVIVPVGGPGKSLMAFHQADGKVAWGKNDFGNVYSSPILINVAGLEQLAIVMDGAVLAINPHNGDLQWQVPFKADYSIAVATPVWGPDSLLFVSSEYNAAVDARSGKIHWQERSIEKATFVWADQKLITLDQDGNLMIAYPSPEGFKIAAKASLLTKLSWTPPVLVGTRLYIRDRRSMMAVDLG